MQAQALEAQRSGGADKLKFTAVYPRNHHNYVQDVRRTGQRHSASGLRASARCTRDQVSARSSHARTFAR